MFCQDSRKSFWLYSLFLAIAVLVTFAPCLKAEFLNWDDQSHFLKHPLVQELTVPNVVAMFRETIQDIYVPLSTLSFAVEKRLFGFDPFVFHLDNILLHILVACLGMALARRLEALTSRPTV